mmetsp:Transcript_53199/g.99779  ORF Transcript_53199/g.99779 Transcript_53199/m.99779 type:complete len:309 (+) Transcript_53199:66-992(+)
MPPAAALPVGKFIGVFVKQIAKPIADVIKAQSKAHPALRRGCITVGQLKHQLGVQIQRMSLNKSKDQEVQNSCSWWPEDLQLSGAPAENPDGWEEQLEQRGGRLLARGGKIVTLLKKGTGVFPPCPARGPMLLVEWTSRSGEKGRGWIWSKTKDGRPILKPNVVKPLLDEDALESGTHLIGEVFVFGVSAAVVSAEYLRSSRKSIAQEARQHAQEQAKEEALQRDMSRRDEQITRLIADVAQWEAEALRLRQSCDGLRAETEQARAETKQARNEMQRAASAAMLAALAAVAVVPATVLLRALPRGSSG